MPLNIAPAYLWGLGLGFAAGFLIGYAYALRRAHAHAPMHRRGEVELFTTTTPDAFPVGRVYTESGRYRREPHIITRVLDLGSFQDIDGQPHQQWRVYGRPA
jgi:prolipoprotein diacylglyceryltransferase